MIGLALTGGLVFTVVVTAVITYRPRIMSSEPRQSNWRGAMPSAAIFYVGNVTLTSTRLTGVELVGLLLMAVGLVGLIRNRNRRNGPRPVAD